MWHIGVTLRPRRGTAATIMARHSVSTSLTSEGMTNRGAAGGSRAALTPGVVQERASGAAGGDPGDAPSTDAAVAAAVRGKLPRPLDGDGECGGHDKETKGESPSPGYSMVRRPRRVAFSDDIRAGA